MSPLKISLGMPLSKEIIVPNGPDLEDIDLGLEKKALVVCHDYLGALSYRSLIDSQEIRVSPRRPKNYGIIYARLEGERPSNPETPIEVSLEYIP